MCIESVFLRCVLTTIVIRVWCLNTNPITLQFLPNLSSTLQPLYILLKKQQRWKWLDQRSVPETADVSVPEIEVEEIPVPIIPVKETGQVVEIQSTQHKDQDEETTLISKEMLSPPKDHEIETPIRYPKTQNRQPPARYREQ